MLRHLQQLRSHARFMSPSPLTIADYPQQNFRDDLVIQEFDREVSAAIAKIGGRLMGVQNTDSPGVKDLVARNLTWFHDTSDPVKLLALLAAKKVNAILASASLPAQAQAQIEDRVLLDTDQSIVLSPLDQPLPNPIPLPPSVD